jgi:hypothetical protein
MTSPDESTEPQDDIQPQGAHRPPGPLRRRWLWIALSAAVGLAGLAAVNISGHGSFRSLAGAHPATAASVPSQGSGPSQGSRPNPDATKPIPVAIPSPDPVRTSPAPRLPRKLAASLARWDAGPGGAALTAVTNGLGDATQAEGLRLFGVMKDACSKLTTAVTSAKTGPPMPGAGLQGRYARALVTLAAAAADCQAAISAAPSGDEGVDIHRDPRLFHRSVAELASGGRQLYRATAKVAALRHR